MLIVGLTGGIASGKSTVSKIIYEAGIPIIDADLVAREVVEPGKATLPLIEMEFGEQILNNDGTLNRKKLGVIVFQNHNKLMRLNQIMLPAIKKELIQQLKEHRQNADKLCVIDAAILIESGFVDMVDCVVLVFVEPQQQLQRLMERDHCTEQEAKVRIASQLSFEEKRKHADYLIDNSKDLKDTKQQVYDMLEKIALMEGSDG